MEPETKSAMPSYSSDDSGAGTAGAPRPPTAQREPVEHVIHGDRRIDHYAWLRQKDDPRVREYLQEENDYAEAYMTTTAEVQEKVYQEIVGGSLQTGLCV